MMKQLLSELDESIFDAHGNLLSRTLENPWRAPVNAFFVEPSGLLNYISLESRPALAEMRFVIDRPYGESSHAKLVRPPLDILERFLKLAQAGDSEVFAFAKRVGPLMIFCREQRMEFGQLEVTESCSVWKYFACSMTSLLKIAGALRNKQKVKPGDWDPVKNCPEIVARASERAGIERFDSLSPLPFDPESSWSDAVYFLPKNIKLLHHLRSWVRFMNILLALGRVRPWISWNQREEAGPRILFAGPNLMSHLVLQLCLRACSHDSFVLCSNCNRQYPPTGRAPKSGQRNFCPDCREMGVPAKLAQRDLRARRRSGEAG